MNQVIRISKRNPGNVETWSYPGELLHIDESRIIVQAYFDRDTIDVHGLTLHRGDRFVEYYYFDRWFNIFEIYDRSNDDLKGWYCNISKPAEFDGQEIRYIDLALDVIIFPLGDYLVLDWDEFEELELSAEEQNRSILAMKMLIEGLKQKGRSDDLPFTDSLYFAKPKG
jgi:protein associated with RNAse G/E